MNPLILLIAAITGPPAEPVRVTGPSDVVALVAADLATVSEHRQAGMVYVAVPPWMEANAAARAVTYTMNSVGRASTLVHPDIATDKYLRFDLLKLVDKIEDFADFAGTFSRMALLDPRYYAQVEVVFGVNVNHEAEGGTHFDCPFCGKRHKSSAHGKAVSCLECKKRFRVPSANGKAIEANRQLAPHLGLEQVGGLVLLSGSATPIISADVLIYHGLTQVDDIGFYYELKGIDGLTLDELLETLGVNQKLSEDLLAARFAAMNHSGVTGKVRAVELIQGAVGTVTISLDFADNSDFFAFVEDVAANLEKNPFYNILDFKHDASEVIYEQSNGLHGFWIGDGAGAIADSVPDNIAYAERPRPRTLARGGGFGTARLQPGLDCFVCHAKGTFSGMQPVKNDLASPNGFDIYDDLGQKFTEDAIRILASRYGGTLDRELQLIRDDYSLAMFQLVEAFDVQPETEVVNVVAQDVVGIFHDYNDLVDCQRMLLELGYKFASNPEAIAWLEGYLPRKFGSAVARILDGQAVPRNDANRELAEVAFEIYERERKNQDNVRVINPQEVKE